MAQLMDGIVQNATEEVAQQVLATLKVTRKWLIVVDNLDDITVINGLLPVGNVDSHVLITTINPHTIEIPAEGVKLSVMEDGEAAELLLLRLNQGGLDSFTKAEKLEAEHIASLLGFLPLAIEQAASYIREELLDLFKYRPIFGKRQKLLLARQPNGNWEYGAAVATTWSLSFETMESRNPHCLKLLQLFAFLHDIDSFVTEVPNEWINLEILRVGAKVLKMHLHSTLSLEGVIVWISTLGVAPLEPSL